MTSIVRKWGNSLGLRIPRQLAEEVGMTEGATVKVARRGRRIEITPVRHAYTLSELLSAIGSDNVHKETDTGAARGGETW